MKKKSLIWIACAAISIASCNNTETTGTTAVNDSTAVLLKENEVSATEKQRTNWDKVDFTTPIVKYKEVTSKDVDVQGNDNYSIYGLGPNVLFATGKSEILGNAKAALSEVCGSISQHYPHATIRVYGYTDSVGSADANKTLSMQRAEAVKNYMVTNCSISADDISAVAEGEEKPIATNDNAHGRQQNRRVRIVAMNK